MNHKIAIVGSHGTGKTKLADDLHEALELPLIKEIAREYDLNTIDMCEYKYFQRQILLRQCSAELDCLITHGQFISDRSSLDPAAYFLTKCKDVTTREERDRYLQAAVVNCEHYSHMLYVPIEFSLKADGFRFEDPEFQVEIDRCIVNLIRKYVPNVHMITGTEKERLKLALEIIQG